MSKERDREEKKTMEKKKQKFKIDWKGEKN